MGTESVERQYARGKELNEAVFGILKEQQGARRFLLQGLANVRAEFRLLAMAFNLRTLWRVWTCWHAPRPIQTPELTSLAAL